jgi:DNA-binding transcriptional MerR regulator
MPCTIQQLTRRFATTARTLRFYEDQGLVSPEHIGQGPASQRLYSDKDMQRLTTIFKMRKMLFTVQQIKLFVCNDQFTRDLVSTEKLLEQRDTLDQQIADLLTAKALVHSALDSGEPL